MTTLLASPHATGSAPGEGFLDDLTEALRAAYRRIPPKIDYVYDSSFDSPSAGEELFGEHARQVAVPAWTHFPEVAEDAFSRPGTRAALSAADESRLFLQYNYARYRLAGLIEAQERRRSAVRARQMVLWYERLMELQAKLVGANLALVLAMAKRTRIRGVEFPELISEGNMALLRSVEKFDVSRGFKFSTYACRAILKSFHRLATNVGRYRQHFPTEFDPKLEHSDYDLRKHDIQRDDSVEALRDILSRNRASLSDVERTVVMERFALGTEGKGRTLSEVGKLIGLTNERVRQIQNAALAKLRAVLDEDYLAA